MPKFTVFEITDWERDEHEMAGDGCHMPESDVLFRLARETEEKVEDGKWPGLPFTCEAKDEEAALEKYRMKFCDGDYIVPIGADIEDAYDELHAKEWMERHPRGYYNNENDYGEEEEEENEEEDDDDRNAD